jgi:Flp pilus assembly protein TadG
MRNRFTKKPALARRRGFLSLELAMTLPILGAVLFGLLEFSLLFTARGAVVEASRLGARKASLPGATYQDVETEVRRVLSRRLQTRAQISLDPGQQTGDLVTVAVQVPMSAVAPYLLWPIGFSLNNRTLYAQTRMVKE